MDSHCNSENLYFANMGPGNKSLNTGVDVETGSESQNLGS
jgi:hypothetical protein